MSTKAYTGAGATLTIGNVAISQLKVTTFTPPKVKFENVTNLGSATNAGGIVVEEQIPSSIVPGDISGEALYLPNDAGLAALRTAFNNNTLSAFVLTLDPDKSGNTQLTTGDTFSFSGFVSDMPIPSAVDPMKPLTYKVAVTINTLITVTSGS
jgi:hypothetical protein